AQSIKSVKVFFLFIILPSSYHCLPISSPPRIWAMAYAKPRSNRLSLDELNVGSMDIPYEPYPYNNKGDFPFLGKPFLYTNEIGICTPSPAIANKRSVTYCSLSYPPTISCCLRRVFSLVFML